MTAWGTSLRPVKRSLSQFEKESFPIQHRPGKFLLLPAEPGTEIDELRELGADLRDIVAVEVDGNAADSLYEHYFDQVMVHWIEAGQFIERAETSAYSYIHLDYCGFLGDDEVAAIAASSRILAPQARLRVSLMRNRKISSTIRYENLLRETMLLPLINQLAHTDERLGWAELAHEFAKSEDATQLVAAIVILSHFFGINPWTFADSSAANQDTLPPVRGRHWIYNIQRWTYHESGSPPVMETIWMDMMHLPEGIYHDAYSVPVQLYQLLYSLIPVPAQYATTLGEDDDDS